ncbi:MAG TPA: GTP-binding protein, partial [Anaerolineae bacterium]|nr:GTP-binding protein [Anaerolineae bacterium]
MKKYQAGQIKSIALLGNSGSGKTTFAEAMLFNGGITERRGSVENKNTASDYRPIEHENENSIYSSVLYTDYDDNKINILDTPGLDDFAGGVISSLHVADSAVMMINVQNGVEVGTEIHFRHSDKMNKPVIICVNGLDHEKTNFDKSIEMLKDRFGGNVTLVQFPVNEGQNFDAVIDVIKMKMLKYPKGGGKYEEADIPAEYSDRAAEMQSELIEKAAENDESLMEIFFENDTLTEDEMKSGIKIGLVQRGIFPVFCSAAKNNIGVDRLTEFICNVAPAAADLPEWTTEDGKEVKCDVSGPASLFVFKSSMEEHIGEINFFKVISGKITENLDVVNANNSTKERLSQLYVSAGKNRTKVSELVAGDIGAVVKLKNTKTNHTL